PPDRGSQDLIEVEAGRTLGLRAVQESLRRAAVNRQFAPASPPPRHVSVQRGPDHPGPRHRVLAYLAPGQPGPRERFRHEILSELPVADADQHNPQAVIPAGGVKLGELVSFSL